MRTPPPHAECRHTCSDWVAASWMTMQRVASSEYTTR